MKKVLSVALASAMVLGMGANAFAIQYNSGSNDKADWPTDFQFDGSLFVTDKNGDIITDATTDLNDNEDVDFQPGDVIWMPLYAKNQAVYENEYNKGDEEVDGVSNVKVDASITATAAGSVYKKDGKYFWVKDNKEYKGKFQLVETEETHKVDDKDYPVYNLVEVKVENTNKLPSGYTDRDIVKGSEKYYVGTERYKTLESFKQAVAEEGAEDAYVTVDLKKIEGTDDSVGKPNVTEKVEYGHYTGNIDKNWSINLIEKSTGVAELVEKAELYKATNKDYASYSKYTDEIMPNAVYLKITLKKEWKTASDETMKYYVYIADNDGSDKTNEVWVSGKYAPTTRTVDFTWTNDANEPALWEAKESGVAVFDFADKAFFTVKMYKGETMYLDLETAYDKAIAGEMDADADSFYKFDKTNASFAREGQLLIVSDDETLVPYEIDEDGNFVAVDAEYVKDYAVAHTNDKVNGFLFSTKQLGNYVLSTEELGEEVEEPADEETPDVEEPTTPDVEEKPQTDKPNPNTGANDFVGLAVSLAVVSVAAAGALALKK